MCLSNIADRARATLTAATTTVSVGDRVTLICSVEKSAGWKYEWFRRTSHTSEDTINDGLNGNIRVSQGGIYRCRGFRGEPAVYSDKSDEVTLQITFSVTQKPSWSQIFRGERITLTCEVQGGEGVQWEYEWRTPQSQTFRTKQKDWTITASISGDYSCKSRPTDDSYSATRWSEGLRLSVLGKNPPKAQISRSGGTLSCSVNPSSSGWSYYFYRGEKNQEVLTVQNTDFYSNREIRVSQGGVYRCRGGRGEPVYSTEFSDPVTIVGERHVIRCKRQRSSLDQDGGLMSHYSKRVFMWFSADESGYCSVIVSVVNGSPDSREKMSKMTEDRKWVTPPPPRVSPFGHRFFFIYLRIPISVNQR
uniref:Ig-like domain-containing protein n=1 Tax=Oryzias sinensis TaxID=183150 RepID=A0A8C7WVZ7_9TELE